jgi:hypothetical protein
MGKDGIQTMHSNITNTQDAFEKQSAQEEVCGRKSGEVRGQQHVPLASVVNSSVEFRG